MSKDRCCGTCRYSRYEPTQGYVCENGDSDYCADFVEHDFVCEEWDGSD